MIAYSYNKILYWDYQGFVTCAFEWLTLLSWQHFLLELRRGKGWNTALCVESLHFSQLKTYPLEHNILEFQTPCFESNNGKWICVVFVRSTKWTRTHFPERITSISQDPPLRVSSSRAVCCCSPCQRRGMWPQRTWQRHWIPEKKPIENRHTSEQTTDQPNSSWDLDTISTRLTEESCRAFLETEHAMFFPHEEQTQFNKCNHQNIQTAEHIRFY